MILVLKRLLMKPLPLMVLNSCLPFPLDPPGLWVPQAVPVRLAPPVQLAQLERPDRLVLPERKAMLAQRVLPARLVPLGRPVQLAQALLGLLERQVL